VASTWAFSSLVIAVVASGLVNLMRVFGVVLKILLQLGTSLLDFIASNATKVFVAGQIFLLFSRPLLHVIHALAGHLVQLFVSSVCCLYRRQ